ncbi:unnamed protein product [Thlaspi arvense]|uniref:PGG domain-containing protein n=1 Tax=Thlaspi arvense TaxID=13288 RepID=A0AAU9T7R7_THLAR|nr:unnamed protein product [Thlaspi arvense]
MHQTSIHMLQYGKEDRDREMAEMLYKAAAEGNVQALRKIIEKDGIILERITVEDFGETPLHVAAMCGHLDFVKETLNLKPQGPRLASELDGRKRSPLHLASAKGHLEIVKLLISADPEMCKAQDRDGRNPLHLAAIKGRVRVLEELVGARREAAEDRVGHTGETILHLCVKHNQFEALKLLMEKTVNHVNSKDADGNTILHLAVSDKQVVAIKYMLNLPQITIEVNARNAFGFTALDILFQSRRDVNDLDIRDSLETAGASRAARIQSATTANDATPITQENTENEKHCCLSLIAQFKKFNKKDPDPENNLNQGKWLAKKRDTLMVVASLIATMAFQAGLNPPGGVFQDSTPVDSQGNPIDPIPHRVGEAVIAYTYPDSYKYYLRSNTIGFVASVSVILLLISGLPFKRRGFMWIMMVILWLSITSMAFTYAFSTTVLTPKTDRRALKRTMYVAVPVWCGLMAILLLAHTLRLAANWLQNKKKKWAWPCGSSSRETTRNAINGSQQQV